MKFLSRAIYLSLSFCLLALIAQSVNSQTVVINEIAWMGTENSYSEQTAQYIGSYNDEWLELYNNTGSQIDLADWKLTAQDGTPSINLTGNIPAFGFYLLERTDDSTVPNIVADQIYTGALGNNGEDLILYGNTGDIVDKVSCASVGWFAGDNSTKQTMERIDSQQIGISPTNWQTSESSGGTPKAKNSTAAETPPVQEETIEVEPENIASTIELSATSAVQTKTISYPTGIIINEILASPKGSDETEEWIEIFNQNQFEVDLSAWQIKDSVGATNIFTIPSGTKISASGFLVFQRPVTKIVLNNDGDKISLIQPDGKTTETISYPKATQAMSYSRLDSEWFWTDQLTPGAKNIITEAAAKTEGNQFPENNAESENSSVKKGLSAIGEQVTKNNLIIPLIAIVIAIFSAVAIIIIKTKINKI